MRLWLCAALLVLAGASPQQTDVVFAWPSVPAPAGTWWLVEANGLLLPCRDLGVVEEQRCALRVSPGPYTFRLRAVHGDLLSAWSAPVVVTIGDGVPPGVFQVRWHSPITVLPTPDPQEPGEMALTDDLIAFWELEEASGTRNDAHGSNHLTDNNTVLSAAGLVGTAGDFETSATEYLSLSDNAALSLGSDQAFTFAVWVNAESFGANRTILAKDTGGGSTREYAMYYQNGGTLFWFAIWDGSGTFRAVSASTHGAPSTATWYLIIGWHDPVGNVVGISVNDVSNTTAHTTGTRDTTAEFRIGSGSGSPNWDGLIDQVGFWKRVLTSDERTALYNSGAGLSYAALSGGGGATSILRHMLMLH